MSNIVRKTITVTNKQNAWIAAQLDSGRFTNDSELIRDLIRREQERQQELESIRAALLAGEQSGTAEDFDFKRFIAEKRAEYQAKNEH